MLARGSTLQARFADLSLACWRRALAIHALSAALTLLLISIAVAQQGPLAPGEAVVTRFSGSTAVSGPQGDITVINPQGTSASIIDVRAPGKPPTGEHWINEPQRLPITASQVGQVFGVAIGGDNAPDIYLAATSAFGLHRTPDNSDWMPGMWGAGGSPGTIYKLDAQNGYQPRAFANVTLNGRQNSGAALGNIAYDRFNQQLFVSDLETGMIHRIRAVDGQDLGFYDHGVQGRARFLDADNRQQKSLPPIPFNEGTQARITDCPSGQFQFSPECWNIAPNGRRVWGLGLGRVAQGGDTRLYYSVASAPDVGEAATWNRSGEDEKRNTVWSVRIAPGGAFDTSSVRREFIVPDFFFSPQDVTRAGLSRPVSDIAFPQCTDRPVMLIAERGGIRNLGLDNEYAFATPHESRALRYELHQDGVWRPVGRYDVGSYNRLAEGAPYLFANCAGGASFGYGYAASWTIDQRQPDQFVWITADALCSPKGPCKSPAGTTGQAGAAGGQNGDPSEVHGIQGMREGAFGELAPQAAFEQITQQSGLPGSSIGLDQAYFIDTDINVDGSGNIIEQELLRNDATRIGDIAIYEVCEAQPAGFVPVMAPPPVTIYEPGHAPEISHVRWASHRTEYSHYRYGSHWPAMSHNRWGSHWPEGSYGHWPPGSRVHWPPGSRVHYPRGSVTHWPPGSVQHWPPGSRNHWPPGSHTHWPPGSQTHSPPGSVQHWPPGSVQHWPPGSRNHQPPGSVMHHPPGSIGHFPPGSSTHQPPGSVKHLPPGSVVHRPPGSIKHFPPGSVPHQPPGSIKQHLPPGSTTHLPPGSLQHQPPGSVKHLPPASKGHVPPGSAHFPPGSVKVHQPPGSVQQHLPPGSGAQQHLPPGSVKQHLPPGSVQQHQPPGSVKQHLPPGSVQQHQPPGSVKQHLPPGSVQQHQPPGSVKQHLPPGSVQQHLPPGSVQQHLPPGSVKQHLPPGSVQQHQPPGSVRVHQPPGSVKVHQPPGSVQQHQPPGSVRVHQPPGSVKVHQPPGSVKVHQPPGSAKVHQPPGSAR
ncbi:MAG: hypothetical protein ACJ8F3_07925 [Xanthobacteraceae bacterium]